MSLSTISTSFTRTPNTAVVMSEDVLLRDKKIQLSVRFDIVSISIHCGDDYEAQVVFDDLVDRINRDHVISLKVGKNA